MKNSTFLWSCIIIALATMLGTHAQAQGFLFFGNKLKAEITDTRLDDSDTTIVLKYHLSGWRNRYYAVKLYYSNNGGNSYKGPLRAIQGAAGDSVRVGKNREIRWKFFADNPYFDGRYTAFKLDIAEVPKIANGGPANAFLNLIRPGWGDTRVRNGYHYGWIAVGAWSMLAIGAGLQLEANKRYDEYRARLANSLDEHNNLFKRAKRSQEFAYGFFAAGASVYAVDFIGTYIKGMKNRRRLQREREKAEEEKNGVSYFMPRRRRDIAPKVVPFSDGQNTQLSLLWRF